MQVHFGKNLSSRPAGQQARRNQWNVRKGALILTRSEDLLVYAQVTLCGVH